MDAFNPDLYPKELVQGLRHAVKQERFPHAILIQGPEGVGKLMLGLEMSRVLLQHGEKPFNSTESPAARRIQEGNHPDVKWVKAEGEKFLKVDEIREWIHWIRFQPLESNRKVLLVEKVERLTEEALNAFLKILEEPPASTCLILTTDAPARLRATLLSRCFHIHLKPLPIQTLKDALIREGVGEDAAHTLSLRSQGIWRQARRLVESQAFEEDDVILEKLLTHYSYEVSELLFGRSAGKKTPEAKRQDVSQCLRVAQTFIRDCLVWAAGASDENDRKEKLFFKHRWDWVGAKAETESIASLSQKSQELEGLKKDLERNANPKLSIMGICEVLGDPITVEVSRV